MSKPTWLQPDKLASFNDDTFRAELSPRRCIEKDSKMVVISPEEAKQYADAARKAGVKSPVIIDARGRHAAFVWKLYELQNTGEPMFERKDGKRTPVVDGDNNPVTLKRFIRVGEVATFDEVLALVPQAGG